MKKISIIFISILLLLNAYLFKVINDLENRIDTTDDLVINNAINSYSSEIIEALKHVDKYVVAVKTIDKSGSGFIYRTSGDETYIVTAAHVVKDQSYVAVEFNNFRTENAEVLGLDEKTDIAVLKTSTKFEVIPAKLSKISVVNEGEAVIAIGASNTSNYNSLKTSGIVSSKLSFDRVNNSVNGYLVSDTSVKSGFSGGPLINASAEVIGMNVMESNVTGNTYSISIDEVKLVADQLIEYNQVKRIDLGVKFMPVKDMETYQKSSLGITVDTFDGLYVYDVTTSGIGGAIGLKQGDIIQSINEQIVTSFEDYLKAIYQEMDHINIEVIRENNEVMIEALLEVQVD